MRPRQTPSAVLAAAVVGVDAELARRSPDLVLVQGDTTSALGAALAAFHRRVPVAHLEAGLRSGDLAAPFPEEMNRIAVDRMAEILLAPTPLAARRLRAEGIAPGRIYVTGNTVVDALIGDPRPPRRRPALVSRGTARGPAARGRHPAPARKPRPRASRPRLRAEARLRAPARRPLDRARASESRGFSRRCKPCRARAFRVVPPLAYPDFVAPAVALRLRRDRLRGNPGGGSQPRTALSRPAPGHRTAGGLGTLGTAGRHSSRETSRKLSCPRGGVDGAPARAKSFRRWEGGGAGRRCSQALGRPRPAPSRLFAALRFPVEACRPGRNRARATTIRATKPRRRPRSRARISTRRASATARAAPDRGVSWRTAAGAGTAGASAEIGAGTGVGRTGVGPASATCDQRVSVPEPGTAGLRARSLRGARRIRRACAGRGPRRSPPPPGAASGWRGARPPGPDTAGRARRPARPRSSRLSRSTRSRSSFFSASSSRDPSARPRSRGFSLLPWRRSSSSSSSRSFISREFSKASTPSRRMASAFSRTSRDFSADRAQLGPRAGRAPRLFRDPPSPARRGGRGLDGPGRARPRVRAQRARCAPRVRPSSGAAPADGAARPSASRGAALEFRFRRQRPSVGAPPGLRPRRPAPASARALVSRGAPRRLRGSRELCSLRAVRARRRARLRGCLGTLARLRGRGPRLFGARLPARSAAPEDRPSARSRSAASRLAALRRERLAELAASLGSDALGLVELAGEGGRRDRLAVQGGGRSRGSSSARLVSSVTRARRRSLARISVSSSIVRAF